MNFNPDKIRKITSEINLAMSSLEELQGLTEQAFITDNHKVGSAKYSLIVAIEGSIDLCNHVIAKNGLRTPEDYADTIRVMAENGAFDNDFRDSLIQMTRFRNRLVHIYWDIDNKELFKIIQSRLDDIKKFQKDYNSFIAS